MKTHHTLVPLAAVLAIGSVAMGFDPSVQPAAAGNVEVARETTALLTNSLVAAVASISDATPPGSTLEDIEAGSAAVSALVPKCQRTYRLIDATGAPLGQFNNPRGDFEVSGLADLIGGAPAVEAIEGAHLRTLVPLTSDMHPNCMTCHVNYGALPPGTVVGAASFRVGL